jgi:poly(hydroxyalkanoate) depolymerase family esterase
MSARFQLGATAFSVAALLFAASPAQAASWQALNYGGTTRADYYVPDNPVSVPPILVSLHYCSGQASNARSWFQSYADQHGFIIITPNAGGNCFNAQASRGDQRADIASMVAYVVTQNGADPKRVFASGLSSGACMTQALVAAYPDVFAAGSSLAGVPAGAWTATNTDYGWTTAGTTGAQAWGDKARAAYPGYMGKWGRMQIWHGEADTTLSYAQTWPHETGQWQNVHGFMESDGVQANIRPAGASGNWNRASFSRNGILLVETNHAAGIDHDLGSKGLWQDVIRFFELDKSQADTTYGKDTGGTGGMGGMGGMSTGGAAGASAGGAGGMTGSGGMVIMTGGSAGSGAMTGGASGTMGTTGGTVGTTGGAGGTTGGAGGTTGGTVGTTGGTVGTTGGAGGTTGGMGTSGAPDTGGDTTETEPSGCGCRLDSQSSTERSALAALGLGLLGIVLRRRRSEMINCTRRGNS